MRKFLLLIALFITNIASADVVVINKTRQVEATPTISTSAYASGDLIGTKMTLTGATSASVPNGTIVSVELIDKDAEAANVEVVFFDANPSNTTFTDNAAFAPTDADAANIICVREVQKHFAFSTNGVSEAQNMAPCPFYLGGTNTTIYAAIVSRGTPTYTSTSDLTLRVGIFQD